MDWLTNDPDAARALRAADKAHAASLAAAVNLPLALKLEVHRAADAARKAAREAIMRREG